MARRIGFLPAFFTALSVAFAIALFLRIRSYEAEDAASAQTGKQRATSSAGGSGATAAGSGTAEPFEGVGGSPSTITLVEVANASAPPPTRSLTFDDPAVTPRTAPQPAPSPQPVQPAEKPSILTRIAEKILPRSAQPSPQPSQPQTASSNTPSQPQPEGPKQTEEPPKNDDKTSDSTPPRLLAMSFNPPQIRDGEETMLIAEATDDLSGVRSISGTIMGPSGTVQGFACQREAETNRFFARVNIAKDSAEGTWTVNYVNLIDNASNSAPIAGGRGIPPTANFRVLSARPDSQGPTLRSVEIQRRVMRGGEKNMLFVSADDDKSGVNLISGMFQSPQRAAHVGFICRATAEQSFNCEFTAPPCADCGEWQLQQLQLQDKANNMTTVRAGTNDLINHIRVDISSDSCDATPPVVEALVLDQTVVSNVQASVITASATLSDDQCGVLSVSGQAAGPNTGGQRPRLYFSFTPAGDPYTWVAKISVPQLAAKGLWQVTNLQVLDRGQNLKIYTDADPVLVRATFNVQ